jgi:hypothetical protein
MPGRCQHAREAGARRPRGCPKADGQGAVPAPGAWCTASTTGDGGCEQRRPRPAGNGGRTVGLGEHAPQTLSGLAQQMHPVGRRRDDESRGHPASLRQMRPRLDETRGLAAHGGPIPRGVGTQGEDEASSAALPLAWTSASTLRGAGRAGIGTGRAPGGMERRPICRRATGSSRRSRLPPRLRARTVIAPACLEKAAFVDLSAGRHPFPRARLLACGPGRRRRASDRASTDVAWRRAAAERTSRVAVSRRACTTGAEQAPRSAGSGSPSRGRGSGTPGEEQRPPRRRGRRPGPSCRSALAAAAASPLAAAQERPVSPGGEPRPAIDPPGPSRAGLRQDDDAAPPVGSGRRRPTSAGSPPSSWASRT